MDTGAHRNHQLPTHSTLKVSTSVEARAALFLVECGLLPLVRRRPAEDEKAQISHGHVFIWLDGAKGETGLERWTDGRSWGPSRCRDDFLIYEEKSGEHKLTKATYTARRNTHGDPGALWHLIVYYYPDELHTLVDPFTDPEYKRYTSQMHLAYFVSNRKDKSRKAKEIPPPVDASPLSQYDALVAGLNAPTGSPTTSSPIHEFPQQHHRQRTHSQSFLPHQHAATRAYTPPLHQHQYTQSNAHHHHQYHQHQPRAHYSLDREQPSPTYSHSANALARQYEGLALRHDDERSLSPSSAHPSNATRRRQQLPPLTTTFGHHNTAAAAAPEEDDEEFDDEEEEDEHGARKPKPYVYAKAIPADYHRLPPPSSSNVSGGGASMMMERGRAPRDGGYGYYSTPSPVAAAGGAMYGELPLRPLLSPSPSPSPSPGLSLSSTSSASSNAGDGMDVDGEEHSAARGGRRGGHRERRAHVGHPYGHARGVSVGSAPGGGIVVAPTPIRAYPSSLPREMSLSGSSNSPPTPHAALPLPASASGIRGMMKGGPSAMAMEGVTIIPPGGSSMHLDLERDGGSGMAIDDTPTPTLTGATGAAAAGGGAPGQAAAAGGRRSREDEKVLMQLSRGWTSFF